MSGGGPSSAGPMSDAFFMSRNELLSWVNNLLGLNLTKVEQVRAARVRVHRRGKASALTAVCGNGGELS